MAADRTVGPHAPTVVADLEDAQRLGFLGARPIADVIEHARQFVRALEADVSAVTGSMTSVSTVIDLGSGGGVPGLVVAADLPLLRLTMIDRRAKRTDFLERVVRRHGWQDRVRVVCEDVEVFARDLVEPFDAAIARGFGPPDVTVRLAARVVRPGGLIVISEPPTGDRWDADLLTGLGLRRVRGLDRGVIVFVVNGLPTDRPPTDG